MKPTHGVPETSDGALRSLAQDGLELGEGVLDRIEVGAVGQEEEEVRAGGLDQRPDLGSLVARQVVHDDDVARTDVQLGLTAYLAGTVHDIVLEALTPTT